MLGLSSLTELRLAFYGVLLAAIASWLVYERHHLIVEGEARIKARDTQARAAQKAEDEKTSAGVVNELQSDNEKLRALASEPAPTLRVCITPSRVRATTAPSRAQPGVAGTAGEGSGGVPAGTAQLDIGTAVRDLKWSTGVVSDYRDRTWEWSVKQASPTK